LLLSRIKSNYRPKKRGMEKPLLNRTALHLASMHWKHPASGETIQATCDFPKDFQVALKYLRRYAPPFDPGLPPLG
jgi:hypothetical protein